MFVFCILLITAIGLCVVIVRNFKKPKRVGVKPKRKSVKPAKSPRKVVETESERKGREGENEVILALKKLDNTEYIVLNDIYVPYGKSNKTAQCDHIVVSKYGIFVVETKNYSGRVVGNTSDTELTQILGGKKYRFYNPVLQNKKHIETLAKFLCIRESYFIGIVNFCDKTDISGLKRKSSVVNTSGLLNAIKTKANSVILSDIEVKNIEKDLKALPKSMSIKENHKNYVKNLRK